MGKGQDPVTEADLHAFLDEEIGPERRAKIAEHLEQKPLDAALVDTWRTQNEALRGAFARVAREPVPLSLSLSQPLTVRAAAVPIPTSRLWRKGYVARSLTIRVRGADLRALRL